MLGIEMNKRITGMLGFARRAGKTVIGTDLVCRAMPTGTVKLVVVADSASVPTKKKLFTKSEFYGIQKLLLRVSAEELGHLLGKSNAVVTVAITDERFAEEIIKAAN